MPETVIQSDPGSFSAGDSMNLDKTELILFDLDGTLVDSVGDLAYCANEMLRSLNMPLHDPEMARRWVGNGLERFIKRVLTNDMDAEPDADLLGVASRGFRRDAGQGRFGAAPRQAGAEQDADQHGLDRAGEGGRPVAELGRACAVHPPSMGAG